MSRSFEFKNENNNEDTQNQMLYEFHIYLETLFSNTNTYISIDANNLNSTIKNLNLAPVDLESLWKLFSSLTKINRAMYYVTIDSEDNNITKRLDWMNHHGYTVFSKALKFHGSEPPKGDTDVEMVVDMTKIPYEYLNRVDTLILFSGNGDFVYPVQNLMDKGIKTVVISSTINGVLSISLRKACSYFVELKTLMELANRTAMLNIKKSEDWLGYLKVKPKPLREEKIVKSIQGIPPSI